MLEEGHALFKVVALLLAIGLETLAFEEFSFQLTASFLFQLLHNVIVVVFSSVPLSTLSFDPELRFQ